MDRTERVKYNPLTEGWVNWPPEWTFAGKEHYMLLIAPDLYSSLCGRCHAHTGKVYPQPHMNDVVHYEHQCNTCIKILKKMADDPLHRFTVIARLTRQEARKAAR